MDIILTSALLTVVVSCSKQVAAKVQTRFVFYCLELTGSKWHMPTVLLLLKRLNCILYTSVELHLCVLLCNSCVIREMLLFICSSWYFLRSCIGLFWMNHLCSWC